MIFSIHDFKLKIGSLKKVNLTMREKAIFIDSIYFPSIWFSSYFICIVKRIKDVEDKVNYLIASRGLRL